MHHSSCPIRLPPPPPPHAPDRGNGARGRTRTRHQRQCRRYRPYPIKRLQWMAPVIKSNKSSGICKSLSKSYKSLRPIVAKSDKGCNALGSTDRRSAFPIDRSIDRRFDNNIGGRSPPLLWFSAPLSGWTPPSSFRSRSSCPCHFWLNARHYSLPIFIPLARKSDHDARMTAAGLAGAPAGLIRRESELLQKRMPAA